MKSPLTKRIGMNICRLRGEIGWTQQELADEMDVDLTTVQRHESGRALPNAVDLYKLSLALKVSMEELYHGLPRQIAEVSLLHPRKVHA